jgi:hypothetical protein
MPKCFVFAIGGTGSRVLRSLTHLFASGIRPNNDVAFDIVPIIIDPHSSNNEDLDRTKELMNNYREVRALSKADDGFFGVDIKLLKDVSNSTQIDPSFSFDLDGSDKTFRQYICYEDISKENKALANLLFSGTTKDRDGNDCKLLDINMNIGFVGNPNVGSVVLNQLKKSKPYKAFASALDVNGDDRIFIISSIFGGTGAAGFPCLLKNIRAGEDAGSGHGDVLKKTPVGAVTVLPYFKLESDANSPINYADFIAKTKSALSYYHTNVTGSKLVNVMYYVGDNPNNSYPNNPGVKIENGKKKGQKNDAHFVELVSALAIIDFLSIKKGNTSLGCEIDEGSNSGKAAKPMCKQFSLMEYKERLHFSHFHKEIKDLLTIPLSQFTLFRKFMEEKAAFEKNVGKMGWCLDKEMPIDANFKLQNTFYTNHLGKVFDDFGKWMKELADNERAFDPLDVGCSDKGSDLNALIKGAPIKSRFTYDEFIRAINENFLAFIKKGGRFSTKEEKVLKIFYGATKNILEKIYNQ